MLYDINPPCVCEKERVSDRKNAKWVRECECWLGDRQCVCKCVSVLFVSLDAGSV